MIKIPKSTPVAKMAINSTVLIFPFERILKQLPDIMTSRIGVIIIPGFFLLFSIR